MGFVKNVTTVHIGIAEDASPNYVLDVKKEIYIAGVYTKGQRRVQKSVKTTPSLNNKTDEHSDNDTASVWKR